MNLSPLIPRGSHTPPQVKDTRNQVVFGVLRYILAGLVVVAHLGPLDLKYMGYYAVLCFFTLSGYILSAAYGRYCARAPESAYARFYLNRLLRVFPAYLAVVILSVAAIALFPGPAAAIHPQCIMPGSLTGWVGNILVINTGTFTGYLPAARLIPSAWSLAVELIYWLVLPLMLGRPRLLLAWLAASLALLLAIYIAQMPLQIRYFSLWGGGAAFAVGACLYHFNLPRFIGVQARPFILTAAAIYYAAGNMLFADPFYWGLFGAVFVNGAIVAACAGLREPVAAGWRARTDAFLGNLAYPIFLVHIVVGIVVHGLSMPLALRSPEMLILCFALTNIAAYLIWRFVEKPVEQFRTRVRGPSA